MGTKRQCDCLCVVCNSHLFSHRQKSHSNWLTMGRQMPNPTMLIFLLVEVLDLLFIFWLNSWSIKLTYECIRGRILRHLFLPHSEYRISTSNTVELWIPVVYWLSNVFLLFSPVHKDSTMGRQHGHLLTNQFSIGCFQKEKKIKPHGILCPLH